jgi:hypothetical protein
MTLQAGPGAQIVQTPYGYNVMGPQNILTALNPMDPRIDFVNPTVQAGLLGGAIGTGAALHHAWQPHASNHHNYKATINGNPVFLQGIEGQDGIKHIYSDGPNKGLIATFDDASASFWGKGKQAQRLNTSGKPLMPTTARLLTPQGQTAYVVKQLPEGGLRATNPVMTVMMNTDGFITSGSFKHGGHRYNIVQQADGSAALEASQHVGSKLKQGFMHLFGKGVQTDEAQKAFDAYRTELSSHKALGIIQQAGGSLGNLAQVQDLGLARNGFRFSEVAKAGAAGVALLAGGMLLWQGGKWAVNHWLPQMKAQQPQQPQGTEVPQGQQGQQGQPLQLQQPVQQIQSQIASPEGGLPSGYPTSGYPTTGYTTGYPPQLPA